MNKQRRKELARITEQLQQLAGELQAVRDAEQDAFDNMPESLQSSDRGNEISEKLDTLSAACDDLDSVVNTLEGDC